MKRLFVFVLVVVSGWSCSKYLSKVSDQSLIMLRTAANFQAFLDNNQLVVNSTPGLGPLGTDDLWISDSIWLSLGAPSGTAYNWQMDIFQGQASPSWDRPYASIYIANVVLGALRQANDSLDPVAADSIRGAALFYRAFHMYRLEEVFGLPYKPGSAATDLGIPLRLTNDLSKPDKRATVQQVYMQILSDARQAARLLSPRVPWQYRNRPSRPAAYALLTEVCLTMQDYSDAKLYADSALRLYSGLVGYDTVDAAKRLPFSVTGNDEVLFECSAYNYSVLLENTAGLAEVDTALYALYAPGDLRARVFFKPAPSGDGGVYFKGSYTGQFFLFSGLSVDVVYLSRAECRVRLGDIGGAMNDLNMLLRSRYAPGTFMDYSAATKQEALQLVLTERRKETVFREVRWADLRRLNQDSSTAVYLCRVLGPERDTLAPMDPRYTYPIPANETNLGGIPQNLR